jgi:hypothetical protein
MRHTPALPCALQACIVPLSGPMLLDTRALICGTPAHHTLLCACCLQACTVPLTGLMLLKYKIQ